MVSSQQSVIRAGPYRLIRHPGYLGILSMWIGAAFATGNWVPLLVSALVMGRAYAQRIKAEEKMLVATLGDEYGTYRAHTWKLVPFVY